MRVNFNVPDELVSRLDAFCKENYSTRSTVMCQACDQFLTTYEAKKLFSQMTKTLKRIEDSQTIDEQSKKDFEKFFFLCETLSGGNSKE